MHSLGAIDIAAILEGTISLGQSLYQARRQLGPMDDGIEKVLLNAHYEIVVFLWILSRNLSAFF